MSGLGSWGRPKGIKMSQEEKEAISIRVRAWHKKHKVEHKAAVKAGILKARTVSEVSE